MTLSTDITQHVELICLKGCTAVREMIIAAGQGKVIDDIADLPQDVQHAILAELKSIMSVYDKQTRN